MNQFGTQLRSFRARGLSQQKLGELLGTELGIQRYSGAAISDWERGKSKIHADDRLVLVALIKTLHEYGELKTIENANQLLEAGNYRSLNLEETRRIFQEIPDGIHSEQSASREANSESTKSSWLADMFSISQAELNKLVTKAKEGPEPSWPRVLATLMRNVTDGFSVSVITILWVAVWFMTMWWISPSLRFPFADYDSAFLALCMYAGASLIIPLFIGTLINTKDSEYWNGQSKVNPFLLRLYTYQGAGIGFNVGYFLIFPLSLARHYLGFEPTIWIEILAATVSVILGNMGARVVPHNLWLAFKQLSLRDGWIFFVVALMGPLWAFFFLEFYSTLLQPVLGIIVILLALIGVIFVARTSSKKRIA